MFSAPEKNVEQLNLVDGETVADFGCGSGAYTIAAAKVLHGTGKVYAIDVQKDLLTRLQNTCTEEHLGNVSMIWGNIEEAGGTKLRDGSVDMVIISNVLFQAAKKETVLEEAKRSLRIGGKLLIIDWTSSFNSMGPTPDQVFPELDARALAESQGLSFVRDINAGNFHYGALFVKRN